MRTVLTSAAILLGLSCIAPPGYAGGESALAPVLMDVQLDARANLARLKPGDSLRGTVRRGVYSGARQLVPAGSPIRLTVTTTERHRKETSERWPWAVRLFVPKHTNSPSSLAAVITLPGGATLSMPVSLASTKCEVKLIKIGRAHV